MLSVYSEIPVLSIGHPARNSLFMKAIRDAYSVFQEVFLKKKKKRQFCHIQLTSECVCTVLKISEKYGKSSQLKYFKPAVHQVRLFSTYIVIIKHHNTTYICLSS
jgi:hypothetical protein